LEKKTEKKIKGKKQEQKIFFLFRWRKNNKINKNKAKDNNRQPKQKRIPVKRRRGMEFGFCLHKKIVFCFFVIS